MMEAVGSVSAVCGRVTAVDDDGRARQLRLWEPVYPDETLVTALDSAANVRLLNGMELYLAPGTLMVLDADIVAHDGSADDGSLRLADVQRVLRWLQPPARYSAA